MAADKFHRGLDTARAKDLVAAGAKPAETVGELTQGQVQLLVKKVNEKLIAADERHASEQKIMAILQDIMDSKAASSAASGGIQTSNSVSKKEQAAQPPTQHGQIPEAEMPSSVQKERMLSSPTVIDVLTVENVREKLSSALKETDFIVDAVHAVGSGPTASGVAFTLKQKAHVQNPLPALHMHVMDTPVEVPLKEAQTVDRGSSVDRSSMIAPTVEAAHLASGENASERRHRVVTVQNSNEITAGHLSALLKTTEAMMHPEIPLSLKMTDVSAEILAAFSVLYLQQAFTHSLRLNDVLLDANAFSVLEKFNAFVPSGGTDEGLHMLSSSSAHDAMMNPFSGAQNPLSLLQGAVSKAQQSEEEESARRMGFRFS